MSLKPKNLTREKPFQIYVLKAPKPYRSSHKRETLTFDELETANKYKKELPIKIYELKAPKSENKGNITQTYKTFKSKSLQPQKRTKEEPSKSASLNPPNLTAETHSRSMRLEPLNLTREKPSKSLSLETQDLTKSLSRLSA